MGTGKAAAGGMLALLLSVALAGCGGDTADPGPAAPGPEGEAAREEGWPLPRWQVGDAWTYTVDGEPTTYGVTSETATDWIVDTDSDGRAFADAQDDISRLGPQRKSDLAGSQGGDRVQFFQWPLAENRTWGTRWDQQDVKVRVTAVTADGAALEARLANGTLVYNYTYDSRAGWFGELRRFDPDGTEAVALVLSKAERGWAGPGVRYALKSLYLEEGADFGYADAKSLQPEAGATDLWIAYRVTCTGTGGFIINLQPADAAGAPNAAQRGYTLSGPCDDARPAEDGMAVPGPMASPWLLVYNWGSQATEWTIEVLQRTRTEVPVGGQPVAG